MNFCRDIFSPLFPVKAGRVNYLAALVVTCLAVLILANEVNAAAFKAGDKVWSKQRETRLLAEPKPLAALQATVGFAEKLKVKEVQGAWLLVKGDKVEGWVFQGNIAGEKPQNAPSVGLTQVTASQTDTVAAARPLAPAAQGYAQRHGAANAESDIDWVDLKATMINREVIVVWMINQQLGEYQP
jgi:hypothetical protein